MPRRSKFVNEALPIEALQNKTFEQYDWEWERVIAFLLGLRPASLGRYSVGHSITCFQVPLIVFSLIRFRLGWELLFSSFRSCCNENRIPSPSITCNHRGHSHYGSVKLDELTENITTRGWTLYWNISSYIFDKEMSRGMALRWRGWGANSLRN